MRCGALGPAARLFETLWDHEDPGAFDALVLRLGRLVILPLLLALVMGRIALAKGNSGPEAVRCIWLPSVQSAKVIDDRTILFHMPGRRVLKMTLTFPCSALKFYDFFGYTTQTDQLCARLDMIVSRSGERCPIQSIEVYHPPSSLRPSPLRKDRSRARPFGGRRQDPGLAALIRRRDASG